MRPFLSGGSYLKKHLVEKNINATLFMPRNQKDCDEVVRLFENKLHITYALIIIS